MSSIFKIASADLFFKSSHAYDPRLGDLARSCTSTEALAAKPGCVLLGHPDDEGIRLNNGRPGAEQGPDLIRKAFYRLTPGRPDFSPVYDVGNSQPDGTSLSLRQNQALDETRPFFEAGHCVLSLGGGHDHAYSDVGAFLATCGEKTKPAVINIDAHFDLRPAKNGPHSGTPFSQLLEKFKFDLFEIGIQPHANSLELYKYAQKKNVKIFDFLVSHGRLGRILQSLKLSKRPVFLSVDIDAFSSAFAPGASAASPIGLDPNEFLAAMPYIATKMNIRGLGIYEVSPPFDIDGRTAKLAAILLHAFLLHRPVLAAGKIKR